ncbi:MAG: glycosyltransferase family 1 protein [Acidobacteriota bacterium]
MRIAYDVRPLIKKETGVGVYLKNLLENLAEIDKENEYYLFSGSVKDRFPEEKIPEFSKYKLVDVRISVNALNYLWNNLSFPKIDLFFKEKIDVCHSPTPLIIPTKGKKVITVHDLFFLEKPEWCEREIKRDYAKKIKKSIKISDGIITPSYFTKKDVLERFEILEKKIRVIHHGVNKIFTEFIPDEEINSVKSKYNLPKNFILFVGNLEKRKNIINLLKAFSLVCRKINDLSLLLIGDGRAHKKEIIYEVNKLKINEKVSLIGYVKQDELPSFYKLCLAFVFPSLWEGFGLPLLEAIASGVPVAASKTTSIPEVAENSALYFDSNDIEDMAEKLEKILTDIDLRRELIKQGKDTVKKFSWKRAAEETLSFYQEIL